MLSGGAYFINKKSKHLREAAEYIFYTLEKPMQLKLMAHGLTSARWDVYNDPAVQQVPYMKALKRSLDHGFYMIEAGPDAKVIEAMLSSAIEQVWKGQESASEALTVAAQKIRETRSRYFQA